MTDLSIIIVSWNTRDLLAKCLASVYRYPPECTFEVFVVDNASGDDSAEMVQEQFLGVHLIRNSKNVGFARANNQAVCISRGQYVLLLNSDTIVQPGALEAMVSFADQHPEAGIVGCKLLNADGSLQPSWAQFPTLWSELMGRNFRKRRPLAGEPAYKADWVGGACMLVRRQAIWAVGLLDERFFMYSEETDWCFRMARGGWQVFYLPGAHVVHLGGASSRKEDVRTLIGLYRSKLCFFRKHYGASSAQALRLGMIMVTLLKMVILLPLMAVGGKQRVIFRRQQDLYRALRYEIDAPSTRKE